MEKDESPGGLKLVKTYHFAILVCSTVSLLFLGLLLSLNFWSWNNTFRTTTPLIININRISTELSTGHLWLEELVSGDKSVQFEDVWRPLKAAEQAVSESAEGINDLVNQVGSSVLVNKLLGHIERVKNLLIDFGKLAQERLRNRAESGVGSEIDQRIDQVFKEAMKEAEACSVTFKFWIDNELLVKQQKQFFLILGLGIFIFAVGSITLFYQERQRRHAEIAVRESEERFRSVTQSANDAIISTDSDGKIISWNKGARQIFGYDEKEILGKPFAKLIPERLKEDHRKGFDGFISTSETKFMGKTVELEGLRKDGLEFPLDLSLASWETDKGVFYSGIIRDTTERKKAEQEIKTLASFPSGNVNPVMRVSKDGLILFCNTASASFLNSMGCGKGDFLPNDLKREIQKSYESRKSRQLEYRVDNRTFSILLSSTKDTDYVYVYGQDITERKKATAELARLGTAIEQAAEMIIITDTGGTIQYVNPAYEEITGYSVEETIGKNPNIVSSGKQSKAFYREMWDTLRRGEVWRGHFINKKKNGSPFEEDATISPIADSAGAAIGYVAVKRDVTRELMLEKQIRQSQKMEAIGTLAGGIAHDFNNILTSIIGFTEMSMIDAPKDSEISNNLMEVMTAGKRATELVKQILTFSQQIEQEHRPITLDPIVIESIKLLRASLPSTIEIRQFLHAEPLAVMADPTQISQVIMNLATNAVHAMLEKEGDLLLTMALETVNISESFAEARAGMKPGQYQKLTVSDTGCGMDKMTMDRIFEPFFTTKKIGEGTGIGLSTVHGIVTSCGGIITVDSKPGEGSSFQVYLPVAPYEAETEAETTNKIIKGKGRILFVDDEEQITRLVGKKLTFLGYNVTTNTSGVEALEIFKEAPDTFDLVVTDLTMPKMTGDALVKELLKIRPDLPIILCTGIGKMFTPEKVRAMGVCEVVAKPILMNDFAGAIQRALNKNMVKEI